MTPAGPKIPGVRLDMSACKGAGYSCYHRCCPNCTLQCGHLNGKPLLMW